MFLSNALSPNSTQLVMGSMLFPLFKTGMSAEMAWRTVCIVPGKCFIQPCPLHPSWAEANFPSAVVGLTVGITILFISDDAPKGNYKDMKKNGTMAEVSAANSFRSGALNFNTWLLFVQYACCFGVELTMNNAAALYFREK